MEVREATPGDAPSIAAMVAGDLDADRLIVDRQVIVADAGEAIQGFLAYDAWGGTVHVTALAGDPVVLDALLAEPRRFADREGLPLEIVVPESDTALCEAVQEAGFAEVGEGPQFQDEPSLRFRDASED